MTTAALDMVPAIAVIPGRADSLHRMRLALPSPGPHEALVQTIRVGVCGTDRDIMRGEFGQAPAGSEALVIGHEVLGRVAAVGSDVRKVQPGDLVTATVRRPDGCPACKAGQPDMCLWRQYS